MRIEEVILKGDLKYAKASTEDIEKEIKESRKDIERSRESFSKESWKWCIIQSYFAMFHSARAVLLKLGYRERAHYAVTIVLEDLVKRHKLESYFADDLKAAKFAREEADYDSIYSKERAEQIISSAEEFIQRMKKLISEL